MPTGKVKWFDNVKGYGFIEPDAGGKDAFVHISAIERSGLEELQQGQKVSYEMKESERTHKMCAEDIQVL